MSGTIQIKVRMISDFLRNTICDILQDAYSLDVRRKGMEA